MRGLAAGLDTMIGELGATMSAGERQRLGIARILLTDARVVLADEPTANLDVELEAAVPHELTAWAAGRTLLMVSHRAAALRCAHRAYRVSGGRLQRLQTDGLSGQGLP